MKRAASFAVEPGVPHETMERLQAYTDLLTRWSQRINLVSARDLNTLWPRHILDSLQLAPLFPPNDRPIADLGSGAGFPGLVLAVATSRPIHLVEADRRKAAFLTEAARVLDLDNVAVHPARAEDVTLAPMAAVTARAFAPLPALLVHAHRFLAVDGIAVFPKGRTVTDELTAAARDWTMHVERFPSRTDPEATVLRLREIRPLRANDAAA